MKNRIFKLLVLVLSLVLIIGAAVITAAAEDTETSPTIISKNLEYGEKFSLMYAVDASTVAEGPVTLKVYGNEPAEGVAALRTYTSATPETITVGGKEYSAYVFITEGVAAKDMADEFYAQATDANGKVGAAVKYSVVEYLLERLYGGYTLEATQTELYTTAYAFGIAAQNQFAPADTVRMADYRYVRVVDGTVNGVEKGMFLKGEVLTLSENAKGWQATVADGEPVKLDGNTYTVEDNVLIETYVRPIDLEYSYFTTQTAAGEKGITYDGLAFWKLCVRNSAATYAFLDKTSDANDYESNTFVAPATVDGESVYAVGKNGGSHAISEIAFYNINSADKNCVVFESDVMFSVAESDQITDSKIYFSRFGFTSSYANGGNYAGGDNATVKKMLDIAEVAGAFDTEANKWGEISYKGQTFESGVWYKIAMEYYKNEGVIKYYVDGYLINTVEVEANLDCPNVVFQLQGQAYGSRIYLDNTYFGTVDKTLAE